MTLSDRVRYNSLRGPHDIHFNMSGHVVTQSDTAQPEQVIMTVTPPSKEVMDKLGKDFVGHWETEGGTKWLGCIPLKVDMKMNVYAPTGDEDVSLRESEADITCCFCNKMHQCSTDRSPGGFPNQEIGLEEESRLRLSSRMVDYARDDAGSHIVTFQSDGVDFDGSQASRQDTVRFSNTGDATITSKTTQPTTKQGLTLKFNKVSRVPKPLSDRFQRKKERPAENLKTLENPWQAMSDADIDAAVRFCDDVLSAPTLMLLAPTLEKGALNWGSFWYHRTVTYPVARIETPDAPALFVKIEIPKKGAWDASVVTASGACVARWSQIPPAMCCPPPMPPPYAAPLVWGGKHFGEVTVEPAGNPGKACMPPGPAIYAKGLTQDVVFAEDFNSKRNDLKALGLQIMLFSCFWVGLPCWLSTCAQADGEPYEALFKTAGGAEIGGFKIETHRECFDLSNNTLPKTEAVVRFGSMTAEQRRLALVTIMQGAAMAAHPKEGGGGGGGGGGA